ncbi:uncharacterized protein LOC129748400 [Uranotaenia lowii]|uniref:uncharacterized protein LOC129748400 n=1 Tax=Uranotaenia lowii TaxID=190385 RepID=UPI00247A8739|nr:uncharacterized protein LOC129748400 [Uranotaenia lowii]XP_055598985.1 uncharacterized protein LOC129748400 [Uranotaenia lowii]XP_055598986.1 uncharacterized protein LOC129748400 [Uranotaenia lowii]
MGSGISHVDDPREPTHKLIAACITGNREVEYEHLTDTTQQTECCFPTTNRPSRSSARSINEAEVEQKILARISQIKHADDSFHMEKKMLRQNKNVPIGRSSSPTRDSCSHCEHEHQQPCCLYTGDNKEDLLMYPRWKSHLEQTTIAPGEFPLIPEAISAGSTPNWFPTTTSIEPLFQQLNSLHKTTSSVDSRRSIPSSRERRPTQVFYYITVLNELDNDLEVLPEQRPTPYQLYMQQQVSRKEPQVIVWMPANSRQQEKPAEEMVPTSTPTPPPVFRSLKPKLPPSSSSFQIVKTYRRRVDS